MNTNQREFCINNFNSAQLFRTYREYFEKEFGQLSSKQISVKVMNSGKIKRFISETMEKRKLPGIQDYIIVIQSSTSFTFSGAEKNSFALILLLTKWHVEVGEPLGISSEYYLNSVFFGILEQSDRFKTHISNQPNFFARFYTILDNVANSIINEQETISKTEDERTIVYAKDNIERYKWMDEKTLREIDNQLPLVDFHVGRKEEGYEEDCLLLNWKSKTVIFPFTYQFDLNVMHFDAAFACKFYLMEVPFTRPREEIILFGLI